MSYREVSWRFDANQCGPTSGCHAEGFLELPVEMALVGESRFHRDPGKRFARLDHLAGPLQAPHQQKAMGARGV